MSFWEDTYNEDDYNLMIKDTKTATLIFRNIVQEKKEKEINKDYQQLYNSLPKAKQYAVDNVIRYLLSEDSLNNLFGEFFSVFLEDTNFTIYSIANYLLGKYACAMNTDIDFMGADLDDFKSKLLSFKKSSKPRNQALLNDVCAILSIEPEVLTKGIGIGYSIDENYILEILKEKNIDSQQFFNGIVNEYLKCTNCKERETCNCQKNHIEFMQADKRGLGKFIAKKLDISETKIIIEQEIFIELKEFPITKYFSKLKPQEQRMVKRLISDLHIS